MPVCPDCNLPLKEFLIHNEVINLCETCRKYSLDMETILQQCNDQFSLQVLWNTAKQQSDRNGNKCPHCAQKMVSELFPVKKDKISIEICPDCALLWLKEEDYNIITQRNNNKTVIIPAQPDQGSDKHEDEPVKEKPITIEKDRPNVINGILSFLGLPYEVDEPWFSYKPVVTWIFSAVILMFYIASIHDKSLIYSLGFIPDSWSRDFGITIITSFLMHSTLFHFLSNMYFFLLFGDNVEDDMGRFGYVLLILSAHFSGLLLHALFEPGGDIPLVGASGGISGIISYYAIRFPKKKIGFMFRIYLYIRWLKVPSWLYFGFWILLQTLVAVNQASGRGGSVSGLGHLGGIIIGIIAGFYVGNNQIDKLQKSS